jgi:hypothetical protein
MKNVTISSAGKKIFFACLTAVLAAGSIPAQEQTIGTMQASFTARDWDVWFNKDVITTQAYGYLLEAAQQKYHEIIDVRDIVWAKGKGIDELHREIIASGKIVQVSAAEAISAVVQTSFTARSWDSWFNKKAINTQAYIKLLEAAGQKYPGTVDIIDIVWTSGGKVDAPNTESLATGKVVQAE